MRPDSDISRAQRTSGQSRDQPLSKHPLERLRCFFGKVKGGSSIA